MRNRMIEAGIRRTCVLLSDCHTNLRQGAADGDRWSKSFCSLNTKPVPTQIDLCNTSDRQYVSFYAHRPAIQSIKRLFTHPTCSESEHLRQGAADAHGVSNRLDPLRGVVAAPEPIDAAERIPREIDLRTRTPEVSTDERR